MEIETRTLFIDSNSITQRNGNDEVNITIQENFMTANEGEYLDVQLVSFSCKNDLYLITEVNDVLPVVYNSVLYTPTLTHGFPSVLSVDNEIKADLDNITGVSWNVTYSQYTGKITMTATFVTNPINLALDFTQDNNCAKLLGFENEYYSFTQTGSEWSLTAPYTVSLGSRVRALYLRTGLIEGNFQTARVGITNTPLLASIPITVAPLQYVEFEDANNLFQSHIAGNAIKSFTMRITDADNRNVGLNSGWTAVLKFKRIKEDVYGDLRDLMKKQVDLSEIKFLSKNKKQ